MSENELVCADSLEWLKAQPKSSFGCAVFSPPYSVSSNLFDARVDFAQGGRFLPYATQLSRVCDLWGVNLSPLVDSGRCLPFIETLVLSLDALGTQLWDRWVMLKSSCRPYRGERALSNYEYVLLFTSRPNSIKINLPGRTAFNQESGGRHAHDVLQWKRSQGVATLKTTSTPYSPSIPRQVLSMYGRSDRRVLDPFCGSGTTLRVAKELGLTYVGVDIDPDNIKLCQALGL